MNFQSILLSIIFHTGIFLYLSTFFNPELRQKTEIHHDLISFAILNDNFFEKQKESNILSKKKNNSYPIKKNESIQSLTQKNQKTKILISKNQFFKDKNLEFKKKDIKEVK